MLLVIVRQQVVKVSSRRREVDEQIDHAIVWSILFNRQISLDAKYVNPLRVDTNPNCIFKYYDGVLWFIDSGMLRGKKAIDVYEFIKRKWNLSYQEALNRAKFLYRTKKHLYKGLERSVFKESTPTHRTAIQSDIKLFYENKDLTYWRPYHIEADDLLSDLVYPTLSFKVFKKEKTIDINCVYPTYTLYYPRDHDSVKIFQPYITGRKWTTNTNPNLVYGDFVLPAEYLLVTKSYKDYRVLKNNGYNVCYMQSETVSVHELVELAQYTTLIFCYDRDTTGFNSTVNIIKEFYDLGITVYGIVVPKGGYDDPASYFKHLRQKDHFRRFYDTNISSILGKYA